MCDRHQTLLREPLNPHIDAAVASTHHACHECAFHLSF